MAEVGHLDNEDILSRIEELKTSDDCNKEMEDYGDIDLQQQSKFGTEEKRGGSSGLQGPLEARFVGLREEDRTGQPDRKEEQGVAVESVDTEDDDIGCVMVNEAVAAMPQNRSGDSNRGPVENFKDKLFNGLSKHTLTEKQLQENGYPRPDPKNSSKAKVYTTSKLEKYYKRANLKRHEKKCIRCSKKFTVCPYALQEECSHHWGKVVEERNDAGYIQRMYYSCCKENVGEKGCLTAEYHVHESNKWENRNGYVGTDAGSPLPDGDYGVYAMDCEMVYTEGGLELARVTVTDCNHKSVYETFVRPDTKVIDYNTRFSRITAKMMEGVNTTIRDVQAALRRLFTEKTILIGHSLECDLTAVKLIHSSIVDTAVVFPDQRGPPFKRALKELVKEYLEKNIQNDGGGHDSQEDAISCMKLMIWKLQEDP